MAKKTSLRGFQEYLSGRLKDAAQGHVASSWLGVRAGEDNWLVDLSDSGEIVQAPRLTPVPQCSAARFASLSKASSGTPRA